MFQRIVAALARLWWPRRIAAVLVLLALAASLVGLAMGAVPPDAMGAVPPDAWGAAAGWGWVVSVAAVQVVAAIGLWYRQRWAWAITLALQAALLGLAFWGLARGGADAAGWLRLLPHGVVLALLLLPEGRRSRAALREPGFEPGDTEPASSVQ